jgi:hypothetical protein
LTRALDQLESRQNRHSDVQLLPEYEIDAATYMKKQASAIRPVFGHWGVLVAYEDDLVNGVFFELRRIGKASVPHQESGNVIRDTVNGQLRWRLNFRVYTNNVDGIIFDLGKRDTPSI